MAVMAITIGEATEAADVAAVQHWAEAEFDLLNAQPWHTDESRRSPRNASGVLIGAAIGNVKRVWPPQAN